MGIEVLGSIFTIQDGTFQILLMKNTKEPYKGYWILPCEVIKDDKTVEESIEKIVSEKFGFSDLKYDQCHVFSDLDRVPGKRMVGISLMSIVDEVTVMTKKIDTEYEIEWFPIDNLPKIGYDHIRVIEKSIEVLKEKVVQSKMLQQIFPCDFTLPEIQKVYEQLLSKNLDRRNFRKKFISLDLIEETGDKAPVSTGRPAKLYRFKEDVDNVLLF